MIAHKELLLRIGIYSVITSTFHSEGVINNTCDGNQYNENV
jgi:hypothetical protein